MSASSDRTPEERQPPTGPRAMAMESMNPPTAPRAMREKEEKEKKKKKKKQASHPGHGWHNWTKEPAKGRFEPYPTSRAPPQMPQKQPAKARFEPTLKPGASHQLPPKPQHHYQQPQFSQNQYQQPPYPHGQYQQPHFSHSQYQQPPDPFSQYQQPPNPFSQYQQPTDPFGQYQQPTNPFGQYQQPQQSDSQYQQWQYQQQYSSDDPYQEDYVDPFSIWPNARVPFQWFDQTRTFESFGQDPSEAYQNMYDEARSQIKARRLAGFKYTGSIEDSVKAVVRGAEKHFHGKAAQQKAPPPPKEANKQPHYNATPQSGFSYSNPAPNHKPAPAVPVVAPAPAPGPPMGALTIVEAQQLFEEYNKRWKALEQTDPNIPYPCRGLQHDGVADRSTILGSPACPPVADWSIDRVMQANTQAFFLGVVGLPHTYAGVRKFAMGFNKPAATSEQVKALLAILKKEKLRWHSDKLTNRGGLGDETTLNVFTAVCDLVEFAREKKG